MESNLLNMLNALKPNIVCFMCKDIAVQPIKYQRCQHFFCEMCLPKAGAKESCPQCGLCSGDSIVPDLIISQFGDYWYNMCKRLKIESNDISKLDLRKTLHNNEVSSGRGNLGKRLKKRELKHSSEKKKKSLNVSTRKSKPSLKKSESLRAQKLKSITDPVTNVGDLLQADKTLNTSVTSCSGDEDVTKPTKKSTFFTNTFNNLNKCEVNKENIRLNVSSKASTSLVNDSCLDSSILNKSGSSFILSEKNVHKRNNKGETPLHSACVKGNVEKLKMLLSLGAKSNTKDNAGWTPLQEAADKGFDEIVQILLENDAVPDMPGFENQTPLHMAVRNCHLNIVKMLLECGCNIEARNIYNETPVSLCHTDEMRDILLNARSTPLISLSQNIVFKEDGPKKIILYSPNLPQEKFNQLAKLINAPGSNITRSSKMGLNITHLLVSSDCDLICELSIPVLLAILSGKWIISDNWVNSTSGCEENVLIDDFEVKGTKFYPHSGCAKRARINHMNQLPGLFNGCHFYFYGPATDAKLDNLLISRYHLNQFVELGGGTVLKREPNPESILECERTSPYHAKGSSTLKNCSHYIIYRTDIKEPELKYNMPHVKSLPLTWMIDCIENFKLMEPF